MTIPHPQEIQKQLQKLLDKAKASERAAHEKMKAMLEREKELESEQIRYEKENAEFRSIIKSQQESLHNQLEEERGRTREELSRMQRELANTHKELDVYRSGENDLQGEYEQNKMNLEKELLRNEETFKIKFDEMTQMMENLTEQEKQSPLRNKKESQQIHSEKKRVQALYAQVVQKTKKLDKELQNLEKEKKQYRKTLQDEHDGKMREVKEDFSLRSQYHAQRMKELDQEAERLVHLHAGLRLREQTLTLDSRVKVNELLREKQDELDERTKKLVRLQNRVLEDEKELEKEKLMLFSGSDSAKLGKKDLGRLKEYMINNEKILSRKKKLVRSMGKDHQNFEERLERQFKEFESEKKKAMDLLREEGLSFIAEQKRLRNKEVALGKRETAELKRLNEEYEDLKQSLEVRYIEKNMDLEEKEDRVREEHRKTLEKLGREYQREKESVQHIFELENEALKQLKDTKMGQEEVRQHQQEVSRYLNDVHAGSQNILENRAKDYEIFQSKISEIEELSSRLRQALNEYQTTAAEESAAAEESVKKRLHQQEAILETMEQELRKKVRKYDLFVEEMATAQGNLIDESAGRQEEYLESLEEFEDKLNYFGKAFKDLSESFQQAKDLGTVEDFLVERGIYGFQCSEDRVKAEWPLLVQQRLELASATENLPPIDDHIFQDIFKLGEKWDQWVSVPCGSFSIPQEQTKSSAPENRAIDKPFLFRKYPVTNTEFYQFVHETGYATEAEISVTAIVYHDGAHADHDADGKRVNTRYSNPTLGQNKSAYWLRPDGSTDSLFRKADHPVTQVTWKDALAYCRWKSETTGKTVRLPTRDEWMYVALNFGNMAQDSFLNDPQATIEHCNIEETGIGDTTAVDRFPEHDLFGGGQDLFGNVYEWTLDAKPNQPQNPGPGLDYKIVVGGSFITHFKHIAATRYLTFLPGYCTSFLGFRTVCEEE